MLFMRFGFESRVKRENSSKCTDIPGQMHIHQSGENMKQIPHAMDKRMLYTQFGHVQIAREKTPPEQDSMCFAPLDDGANHACTAGSFAALASFTAPLANGAGADACVNPKRADPCTVSDGVVAPDRCGVEPVPPSPRPAREARPAGGSNSVRAVKDREL
jgi:hypothetical protein